LNLAQIKGRIKNQIDYTPVPSAALGGYLDSVINDAYMEVWLRRPYLFNQKEVDIRIFKDLTVDNLWNAADPVGDNYITWAHASDVASFNNAFYQTSDADVSAKFVGAFITDENGVAYEIVNILSNTDIKLDRPYAGPSGTDTTFSIKHRFAYLPSDLIEIMDISFPNFPINVRRRGKVHSIPRRIDVDVDLNQDLTGSRPNFYIPYAKTYAPEISNTLRATASGAAGLPDDTYYFAYTVVASDGSESGFSDLVGVTTSSNDTITIELADTGGTTDEYRKFRFNVYYAHKRQGQDRYVFFRIGALNDVIDSSTGVVGFTSSVFADIKKGNYHNRRFNEASGTKKIRFHPRPIAVDKSLTVVGEDLPVELTFWHLRYLYNPYELLDDYDTPLIPSEFHHLIIDRALVDVHAKYDNLRASLAAEKRFLNRVKALDARYSTERDAVLQRGQSMQWGGGRNTLPVNRSLIYKG